MKLEAQMRVAVRDAVNRHSRQPFDWGGLNGYPQLQAISQVLHTVPSGEPETRSLQPLARQVDRAVDKNRMLAHDGAEAHTWLRRMADCLRYPPASSPAFGTSGEALTSEQVKRDMEDLLRAFQPDCKRRPAQAAL
jgi:hypothetical protein